PSRSMTGPPAVATPSAGSGGSSKAGTSRAGSTGNTWAGDSTEMPRPSAARDTPPSRAGAWHVATAQTRAMASAARHRPGRRCTRKRLAGMGRHPSKAGTRLRQESGLLGRSGSPQDTVAMGKAPEAGNDVAMAHGVVQVFRGLRRLVSQFAKQRDAALLRGQVFRMFERQVGEYALHGCQPAIRTPLQQAQGCGQGLGIHFERLRRIAPYVARELVQQDDPRQRPQRGVFPFEQPARAGLLDQGTPAAGDLGVEGGILGEPFPPRTQVLRVPGREKPKVEYVLAVSLHHGFILVPAPAQVSDRFQPLARAAPAGETCAMETSRPTKVLVVDDDAALRQLLADYLNRHGYDTLLAPDASDLPARIARYSPDLLVL